MFSSAIQGKGININGMVDQKKLILNKLFKNQKANGPPGSAGNQVNTSFNEQLMNQTNFGFNPARNTLVNQPNLPMDLILDSNGQRGDRLSLNTQNRNRT